MGGAAVDNIATSMHVIGCVVELSGCVLVQDVVVDDELVSFCFGEVKVFRCKTDILYSSQKMVFEPRNEVLENH